MSTPTRTKAVSTRTKADPESGHPVLVSFGQHLRSLRHGAGLTQEDLAFQSGLHWTYVSQVERGTRNLTYKCMLQLAGGLRMPVARLLDDQVSDHVPVPPRWGWDRRG